jgi:signal transduction histidine kinase
VRAAIVPGNGLRGMRERLAQHGGALDYGATPEGGFRLSLWLPASAGAVSANAAHADPPALRPADAA